MKDPLKILDKYDRKDNIYKLILKYAEKGHKILASGTASISDNSLNVLDVVLDERKQEEEQDEHREASEKNG
ncbi:MAG: hypothetical protein NC907_05130 [Candidatus Omnitrophica bacterium]|nr:hypothetical protein [Candidatus Omnitrophota bacterium]MCM8789154.1 hypothetical protein [Candidatus Omnitrophota bacterium]